MINMMLISVVKPPTIYHYVYSQWPLGFSFYQNLFVKLSVPHILSHHPAFYRHVPPIRFPVTNTHPELPLSRWVF